MKSAIFLPIITELFISFGLSTESTLTFFSAPAGAVGTVQAKALTFIASGAAAAFCYFSAAGKVKREKIIQNMVFFDNFNLYGQTVALSIKLSLA